LLVSSLQCAGLIISGANAAYTPTELIHQLKDSATQHLFVHPSVLEVALASTAALGWTKARQVQSIVLAVLSSEAGEAGKTFKSIDQIQARGQRLSPVVIREPKTTIAYLGYSSGTSGAAKGVRTSHWNMTSVLSILYPLDITQHDIHIAVLPLNHIYGATKLTLWPIVIGTPVVVVPRFDLKDFCTLVERYKVTVAMLVPPIALLLAREKIVDDFDMSSLNLVISGAAPYVPSLSSLSA
jgi:acyl-CoA synthetase (AMP-forming)/AMP-acid ligase II